MRRQITSKNHRRKSKNHRTTSKKHRRTSKKHRKMIRFEDVDYATDIDVLTIMSKEKQISALNKVNNFLKSSKNTDHIKEMTKRKKQLEQLIKESS